MKGMAEDSSMEEVEAKFGKEFKKFIAKNSNEGTSLTTFLKGGVDSTLEKYVGGIGFCFRKGNYSSGYGGDPWGDISDCALRFIQGHSTMEMMIDTAYTLAHNNGPIFNKDIIYDGYTGNFVKLLDIQRAGQIPEFLLDASSYGISKPHYLVDLARTVRDNSTEEFRGFVDWFKVEAAGSINKYPDLKKHQAAKHPESIESVSKIETIPGIGIAQFVKTLDIFPGEEGNPTQSVKVYKRVPAGGKNVHA